MIKARCLECNETLAIECDNDSELTCTCSNKSFVAKYSGDYYAYGAYDETRLELWDYEAEKWFRAKE